MESLGTFNFVVSKYTRQALMPQSLSLIAHDRRDGRSHVLGASFPHIPNFPTLEE